MWMMIPATAEPGTEDLRPPPLVWFEVEMTMSEDPIITLSLRGHELAGAQGVYTGPGGGHH